MIIGDARLGWNARWQQTYAALCERAAGVGRPGRVSRLDRGWSSVLFEADGEPARCRNIGADVAVGDWITMSADGERVDHVLDRASAFTRRASFEGDRAEAHTIAANIDVVGLVHALTSPPNQRRLERELVLAWDSGALPILVLTKADLVDDPQPTIDSLTAAAPGVRVVVASGISGVGIPALAALAAPDAPDTFRGPDTSHVPDTSRGPDTFRGPDTSHVPDTSRGPDTFQGPDTPRGPETSDGPDTSRGPETSDGPDTSRGPDTSQGPDTSHGPGGDVGGAAALHGLVGRRTIALLGASGVGKSTLVNALVGGQRQQTADVRDGDGRGRHTTIASQLVQLPGGGWLVDTPGVRAVSLWSSGHGIERAFADVFALMDHCRFRDCKHDAEPGCAVQDAVRSGALDPARLDSMKRLVAEEAALEAEQEAHLKAQDRRGVRKPRPRR